MSNGTSNGLERASTAFQLFCLDQKRKSHDYYKKLSSIEVLRKVAAKWHALSAGERAKYVEQMRRIQRELEQQASLRVRNPVPPMTPRLSFKRTVEVDIPEQPNFVPVTRRVQWTDYRTEIESKKTVSSPFARHVTSLFRTTCRSTEVYLWNKYKRTAQKWMIARSVLFPLKKMNGS